MKTKKTAIAQASLIRNFLPADYEESFLLTADSSLKCTPDDIMTAFWNEMPRWIESLLKFRNFLVRFVGLKCGRDCKEDRERIIREGGENRYMELVAKNGSETVIAMKDKHLDAYLSIMQNGEKQVSANTLVHFHNKLGRIYFMIIRPFHGIIVRSLLKRTVRKYTA